MRRADDSEDFLKDNSDCPTDVLGGYRRRDYKKICAKFTSGIRWGIGFILERTCDASCSTCNGMFACRLFDFKPHYDVFVEPKSRIPEEKVRFKNFRFLSHSHRS